MTLDLREELENATSALAPRGDLVGRAQALGQRRLVVRQLRNVLGGATVVALLALGISNVPAQWSRNFGEVQPGGQATSAPTSIEAALGAVSLPDPAPGFPYRLIPDGGPSLATVDGQQYWIRNFSLAVKPETTTTDSSGTVTGVRMDPKQWSRWARFRSRVMPASMGTRSLSGRTWRARPASS